MLKYRPVSWNLKYKIKGLKIVKTLFAVGVFWFLGETAFTVYDGLTDEIKPSDVGVILGTKVNEDGTLSDRLKARVDKGLELYRYKVIKKIVVSGGLGKEGHYEGIKMKAYLVGKGVPAIDIIVDNEGNNTYLTAFNYMAISEKEKFTSVIVISQYYHIRRTKLIFKKLGFTNVGSAHADWYELRDCYALFREFFGLYKYKIIY